MILCVRIKGVSIKKWRYVSLLCSVCLRCNCYRISWSCTGVTKVHMKTVGRFVDPRFLLTKLFLFGGL